MQMYATHMHVQTCIAGEEEESKSESIMTLHFTCTDRHSKCYLTFDLSKQQAPTERRLVVCLCVHFSSHVLRLDQAK